MRVNSPGWETRGASAGHSPCAGACGSGDWNMRVNSPAPAGSDGDAAATGGGGAAWGTGIAGI